MASRYTDDKMQNQNQFSFLKREIIIKTNPKTRNAKPIQETASAKEKTSDESIFFAIAEPANRIELESSREKEETDNFFEFIRSKDSFLYDYVFIYFVIGIEGCQLD